MTIEQTINKAIEGGYKDKALVDWCERAGNNAPLLIDPLFWQALGRAMGWENKHYSKTYLGNPELLINSFKRHVCIEKCTQWKYQLKLLIDHLADVGTIENFFTNLK